MRLLAAFVTVELSTGTCHCVYLHHVGLDAEIRAFLVRAVTDVLILDGITNTDLLSVELDQFRSDGVYKTFEDWCLLAMRLVHTRGKDASIV